MMADNKIPLIYVAGPFRAPTPWAVEQNVRRAEEVALVVARFGGMPVCPHANARYFDGQCTAEFWLNGTVRMLERCDGAVFLPGLDTSKGEAAEWDRAFSLSLPRYAVLSEEERRILCSTDLQGPINSGLRALIEAACYNLSSNSAFVPAHLAARPWRYGGEVTNSIKDQPPPAKTSGRSIWDLVVEDMHERDAVGLRRYGTHLQAFNGRDALADAYQEALDLAAYLRQAIEERGAPAATVNDNLNARQLEKLGKC